MSMSARFFRNGLMALAGLALAGLFPMDFAWSQTAGLGCVLEPAGGSSRRVLRCRDGLTITLEDGAGFALTDRDGNGVADAVRLRRKAILLDAPGELSAPGFQVVTPQAIAAVRGTQWAVDVATGKTSVFVVRGRVAVQRPSAGAGVLLGPGEGVDVEAGTAPLTVKRWPQARVSALLARLGQ